MTIEAVIAEDHEMSRRGLKRLFADSGIRVVGEAATGKQAVALTFRHKPDVVVMDVRMPETSGLTALKKIKSKYREIPVLMFSGYDNPSYATQARDLGASGYLLKSANRKALLSAVKATAAGKQLWSLEQPYRLSGKLATPQIDPDMEVSFTAREREVLQKVAQGLGNREIAKRLDVTEDTIKDHVKNLLRKIGVTDRTQVAIWAVRNGLD